MVAGELFEVFVAKLVARSDHQSRPELERPPPRVVLHVPPGQSPRSRCDLTRADERHLAQSAGADQFGGGAILIEKYLKGHRFIFDERLGVSASPGPDCSYVGASGEDLVVSLTDLTGPFPASQSAEVAEEEDNPGIG